MYDIPFVGTAVCVAIDRLLVTGLYSWARAARLVVDKIDVTPPQVLFQPPPKPPMNSA